MYSPHTYREGKETNTTLIPRQQHHFSALEGSWGSKHAAMKGLVNYHTQTDALKLLVEKKLLKLQVFAFTSMFKLLRY